MIRAAIAVPFALSAAPANAQFAPPLDAPMKLVVDQTRTTGNITRRFIAERAVTFHAVPEGFTAEVILLTVRSEGDPVAGRMFEAGLAGLVGRTIRYRLDATGRVTGIDDLDAAWLAWTGAVATASPRRADRAIAGGQAGALDALPTARKLSIMASILVSLVTPGVATGERAIRIPARSAGGAGTPLDGRETVERQADGLLRTIGSASGNVALPAAAGAADAIVTMHYDLLADAVSGLLRKRVETSVTKTSVMAMTTTTTTTLVIR